MSRFLMVVVAFILTSQVYAENWPQWRGPDNNGVCKELHIPTEWNQSKNIVWKLAMPDQGGSTPAVWNDRIFLTSEDGPNAILMCISTEGKELWRKPLGPHNGRKYMSGEANNASASPSTDGKHVWAFDGAGHLACFDFEGKEIWKTDIQERYGRFRIMHGMHNTPALDGDRLYLNLLHSNAWLVIALDKMTGKEVWKLERHSEATAENEHSYASPFVWRRGNDAYLVVHGNDHCTAHSLVDGKEIWRLAGLNPQRPGENYHRTQRFVASPAVSPDLIVVPTAKKGPTVGVKPDARGTIEVGGEGEQWRVHRNTPDVPCPLIHDGYVYLCGETGMLYCLDAKTGKEAYPPQQLHRAIYRASPVYADGKVFLVARDGFTTVIKAGPKFEKLAENELDDDVTASLAISGGRIYIRGWKTLWAVAQKNNVPKPKIDDTIKYASALTPEIIERCKKALVGFVITRPDGTSQFQTGLIIDRRGHALTYLDECIINGDEVKKLKFRALLNVGERNQKELPIQLIEVDQKSRLVLLQLKSDETLLPFSMKVVTPTEGQHCFVIGFPIGARLGKIVNDDPSILVTTMKVRQSRIGKIHNRDGIESFNLEGTVNEGILGGLVKGQLFGTISKTSKEIDKSAAISAKLAAAFVRHLTKATP